MGQNASFGIKMTVFGVKTNVREYTESKSSEAEKKGRKSVKSKSVYTERLRLLETILQKFPEITIILM